MLTASWTPLRNDKAPGRRVLDQDHPCLPGASHACLLILDRSVQPNPAVLHRSTGRAAGGERYTVATSGCRPPGPPGRGPRRCGVRRAPDVPVRVPVLPGRRCARTGRGRPPPVDLPQAVLAPAEGDLRYTSARGTLFRRFDDRNGLPVSHSSHFGD